MYPCCKLHRKESRVPFLAFAIVLLCAVCTPRMGIAQTQLRYAPTGVSSDTFLREIASGSLPAEAVPPSFPIGIKPTPLGFKETETLDPAKGASKAAFSPKVPSHPSEGVSTAQFASPSVAFPSVAFSAAASTVGSGVAIQSQNSAEAIPTAPSTQPESKDLSWRDRLGMDPSRPNFLVGYEAIGLRRGSDSIGPFSQGADLPRLEQDLTGRYTFSRLLGSMERIEFKFTGPFHWNRESSAIGPVDSNLPASLQAKFNGADSHQQSHRIRFSSYELNRCWTGDELSMIFGGLRFLDLEERYRLESAKEFNRGDFRLETNNFMVGGQIGLNLFRPMSQRLTVGFGTAIGLYGNFASGSMNAMDGATTLADMRESKLRINTLFEWSGRMNYRVSQNIDATCGYEWWYFPSLATVANQRLSDSTQGSQFSLRTGDDQLFRGWTAGLSMRF